MATKRVNVGDSRTRKNPGGGALARELSGDSMGFVTEAEAAQLIATKGVEGAWLQVTGKAPPRERGSFQNALARDRYDATPQAPPTAAELAQMKREEAAIGRAYRKRSNPAGSRTAVEMLREQARELAARGDQAGARDAMNAATDLETKATAPKKPAKRARGPSLHVGGYAKIVYTGVTATRTVGWKPGEGVRTEQIAIAPGSVFRVLSISPNNWTISLAHPDERVHSFSVTRDAIDPVAKPKGRSNPARSRAPRANPETGRAKLHAMFERERARFAEVYPSVAKTALEVQDNYNPTPGACGGFRDIAYADRKRWVVVVAARMARWSAERQLGIIRHELGHMADPKFWQDDKGAELRADAIALKVTGVPVRYDERDVQNVKRGRLLRPAHLHGGAKRRNPATVIGTPDGATIVCVGPLPGGLVDPATIVLLENGKRLNLASSERDAVRFTTSLERPYWIPFRRGKKWNRKVRAALKGKAGVYVIRKRGAKRALYVGEGGKQKFAPHLHSRDPDRMIRTIYRHFQSGFTPEKYARKAGVAPAYAAAFPKAEEYNAGGREWVHHDDGDLDIALYITPPRDAVHHEGRFIAKLVPLEQGEFIGEEAPF